GTPTNEQKKKCYRAFYKAVATLDLEFYAVCAREHLAKQFGLQELKVIDMPNSHRLKPRSPHPDQELIRGILLEQSAVYTLNGDSLCRFCAECMKDLQCAKDKPRAFSLANNMWIGRLPWPLQMLSFPEKLFIFLIYPRVFIYKSFPQTDSFH